MKKKLPYLTRAESELMQLLWTGGPATVADLQGRLERKPAYTTVQTLMKILETKGYVGHEAHPDGGRAHLFRALVAETSTRKRHLKDLVDRLFGGRAESLVNGLIDDEVLDRADLEALKKHIDDKLNTKGNRP